MVHLHGGDVAGVVAWFPPTDLLGLPDDLAAVGVEPDRGPGSREALLLGVPAHADPDLARAAGVRPARRTAGAARAR